jgi:hypothetical protein
LITAPAVAASFVSFAFAQSISEEDAAILRGRLLLLEERLAAEEARTEQIIQSLADENAMQRGRIAVLEQKVTSLIALAEATPSPAPSGQGAAPQAVADASEANARQEPGGARSTEASTTPARTAATRPAATETAPATNTPAPTRTAAAEQAAQPAADDTPETVGERPEEETRRPRIDLFSDVGGILTPRGQWVLEPSVRYSTSGDNRFFFSGVEIVDALLVGVIEARDTERTSVTFTQGVRYGLTNRLEVDVSVPFVSQDDRRTASDISSTDSTSAIRDLSANGLGDISAGLHYQLTNGGAWPYVVGNLRVKAPTGEGPFEVGFDENGNALGAATGSGYWSVEPSLTFIKRVDPVVLFGNLGYQINLETDVDEVIRDTLYKTYDAGDGLRTSFGLGIAMNEAVNLNFGYDQSYIFASETVVEQLQDGEPVDVALEGVEATVGTFLFGVNYRPTPKINLGVSTALGATDEAPDVNLTLRMQYRF